MKRTIFTFLSTLILMVLINQAIAQVPQGFNYQAVARNSVGVLIQGTTLGIKLSIHQGSATGTVVYSERQTPATNQFGLFTVTVGQGTFLSGNAFNTLNWSTGNYWLEVEMDVTGGSTYTTMGTSQLLTVPYALYADKVGTAGYTESDPIFIVSPSHGITATNITNWNTAYGWGNHLGLYRPIAWVPAWNDILNKPNTLSGYGIIDAMSTTHPANGITNTNITNWNTAYGWGNHAGLYRPYTWVPIWSDILSKPTTLTGYGITDAMSATHAANGITNTNITNWNMAYGWGNHAGLYRSNSWVPAWSDITSNPFLFTSVANNQLIKYNSGAGKWENWTPNYLTSYTETDPIWTAAISSYYTKTNMQTSGAAQLHFNNITNKPTTLAGYGITDAMSTSHVAYGITASNITNWNTAYSWGNHAGLYRPVNWVPTWTDVTGKPNFAAVATSGNYNDLINKLTAGPGIQINGSNVISTNLSLQVSPMGDILTLTPGNSVYVPGISNANSSIPIITTNTVTNITSTEAYGSGNMLYYGTLPISETGICWNTIQTPPTTFTPTNHVSSVTPSNNFICVMTPLTANTVYYVWAYAIVSGTPLFGNMVMLTTTPTLPCPTLTTNQVTSITATAAISGGTIYTGGGSNISSRGICWSMSSGPTTALSTKTIENPTAPGTGFFQSFMTGLTTGTTYYVRSYATNSGCTNYGPELIFTTSAVLPTVTTDTVINVTEMTANVYGNISSLGSSSVTERGFCWSIFPNPTISGTHWWIANPGLGQFSVVIENLIPNTNYYIRAYATSNVGTAYGVTKTISTANAFYEGFENGMPGGSSGNWSIVTTDPYEGAFCLKAININDTVNLTKTLSVDGNIKFYFKSAHAGSTATFYIDGIVAGTMNNTDWVLKSYYVSSGLHKFKWKFSGNSGCAYVNLCPVFIDKIIIYPY